MTFSYTDDAIVVLSMTGRERSTLIRRPTGMPNNGWALHAAEVCKALGSLSASDPASRIVDEICKALIPVAVQQVVEAVKGNTIKLSEAEIQSGYDRVKWAEGLIRQLPETHDGRNSWLMNYGVSGGEAVPTGPTMADLLDLGYLTDYEKTLATAGDFDSLEARAAAAFKAPKGRRRAELIATLTSQLASVEAELARAHEQLKAPVVLGSEAIAALASLKPGACMYSFAAGKSRVLKRA